MKTHVTLVVVVGDDDESIGTPTNVSKIHKLQYCFALINIFPPNAPHGCSAAKTPQFLAQRGRRCERRRLRRWRQVHCAESAHPDVPTLGGHQRFSVKNYIIKR